MSVLFGLLPGFLRGGLWHFSNAIPGLAGVGLRYSLARASAKSLGDNVLFGPGVTVLHWENLSIGRNVSIHANCFIDALGGIDIGNDVSIAHGSSLVSFDHGIKAGTPIKYGPLLPGCIIIADDVWISAGVRVLRDTQIGPRSILAANAVAKGTLAGNMVHGGVPAKPIKPI